MATRWWIEHGGRRIEVEPESLWSGNVVRLFADGEQIGETKRSDRKITVEAEGLRVKTWLAWHGATIQRAELTAGEDAAPVPLQPAPGTRAARREAWAREHPGLYSARHAAKGVGEVLFGLIGIAVLLRLLSAIPISIDLPSVDLPSIDLPLPSIDLPDVQLLPTMPGWVRAIGEASKYWVPILIGIGVALREYDRRKRHAAIGEEESGAARERDAAGAADERDAPADAGERDAAGEPADASELDAPGERDATADADEPAAPPPPADVTRGGRR